MNTINCLVVDDEPIAREILKKHISETPGLDLSGCCINAQEAYAALLQHRIDLVFLDIQMPVIPGTNFLRSLKNPPLVIFTTAFSEYALEGFELNAVDYLLKPVTYERFYEAVEKARERLEARRGVTRETADSLFVKHDGEWIKVKFDNILYVEAEREFCFMVLPTKKLLLGVHLKLLEEKLPTHLFRRVHRSYTVNVTKITFIKGNHIGLGDKVIPIGSNYKEALFASLEIK